MDLIVIVMMTILIRLPPQVVVVVVIVIVAVVAVTAVPEAMRSKRTRVIRRRLSKTLIFSLEVVFRSGLSAGPQLFCHL